MTTVSAIGQAQSKPEAAVAQAAEKLRTAMISGDSTALYNISMPQLTYGHSGGHVEGQKEFVDKIASGKSDFVTIDITDQTIMVMDEVAILRHRLHATTNDKGTPGTVDLLVMMVWHKDHKNWKLLARQAVKAK